MISLLLHRYKKLTRNFSRSNSNTYNLHFFQILHIFGVCLVLGEPYSLTLCVLTPLGIHNKGLIVWGLLFQGDP
jgi:hypothetical protein